MASVAETWFLHRAPSAIRDFFDGCDLAFVANEADARALIERTGAAATEVLDQVAAARARLQAARAGDWGPFEAHLGALGTRYAVEGLELGVCQQIANHFHHAVVPRLVEALSAEPARLVGALVVLGDYLERSMRLIDRAYSAAMERMRAAAEARYQHVVDSCLDPIITLDHDGLVRNCNPAAVRLFGATLDGAVGMPLESLVVPDRIRAAYRGWLADVRALPDPAAGQRVEMTARRADGTEIPVELTIVGWRQDDARVAFIIYARDLAQAERTEATEALWEHVLEHAAFGMTISDPKTGTIMRVNPAYARMLGYEPSELRGYVGANLVAAESRRRVPVVTRALEEHDAHTYEVRLVRKDRAEVPVLASSTNVTLPSGRALRVSTVIDMTDRARLEGERTSALLELARTAARLDALASAGHEFASSVGDVTALLSLVARRLGATIGDGCVVRLVSQDGEWLEPTRAVYHVDPAVAAAAGEVLGSRRQRVGEGIAGRVAATGRPVLIAELDTPSALAIIPPAFHELIASLNVASMLAVPLASHGRTMGVVSLMRQVPGAAYTFDDQRLAQGLADRAGLAIDNATLLATLEARVAERTTSLALANEDLESFSYSVSHDLRAPLRAIGGFTRALLADHTETLDEDARTLLRRIDVNTGKMSDLIDSLLDLALATRTPLDLAIVDLTAIAHATLAELGRTDPQRDVDVLVESGLTTRADRRLAAVVMENLLRNAWKFTSKCPTARIAVGRDDRGFYVRDTGVGFDAARADQLFTPFARLHAGNEYEGIGVGLATVRRILRHHGGHISAESEPGRGATFHFDFAAAL